MVMRREDGLQGSVRWHRQVVNRKPNEFDAAVTDAIVQLAGVAASNDQCAPHAQHAVNRAEPQRSAADGGLSPGDRLCDRYEVVEHVHTGGMSHVYKAVDRRRRWGNSAPQHVAIKVMRQSLTPAIGDRLLKHEALKAMQLSHANIVNVYDYDRHGNQFFIVMEWLSGESLNELLRRTRDRALPREYTDRIIDEVVAGLKHVHAKNLVHADLNPANVFITDTLEVKLLDFGVARIADEDDDGRPSWATQNYASPQVLSGEAPTFADDVYSLACLVYRLRAGHLPFDGLTSLEARDSEEDVQPIAGIGRFVMNNIARGLAFERNERPRHIDVFARKSRSAALWSAAELLDRWTNRRWRYVPLGIAVATFLGFVLGMTPADPAISAVPEAPSTAASPLLPPSAAGSANESATRDTIDSQPERQVTEVERALAEAETAFSEERFVGPDDRNARDSYRRVLAIDPDNGAALDGLRALSTLFANRAQSSLDANDIGAALAALAIAFETDADNPAAAAVTERYQLMGEQTLVEAKLAVADGAVTRARRLLNQAERFPNVDSAEVRALRARVNRAIADRRLEDEFATLDDHLSAGRLTSPNDNNAYALWQRLSEDFEGQPELERSGQRLGERLLARAAFAVAENRYAEAQETLTLVGTLGVLEPELAAAQVSLGLAAAGPDEPILQPLTLIDDGSRVTISPVVTVDSIDGKVDGELPLRELVAPDFPRRAKRRGQAGQVELSFIVGADGAPRDVAVISAEPEDTFVSSATKAVNQWRFFEREAAIEAYVTLSFDPPR